MVMASIFTGLAFMHGHIVDRELVLRLGRSEPERGAGTRAAEKPAPSPPRAPAGVACATC
jgi:hypothetical protein